MADNLFLRLLPQGDEVQWLLPGTAEQETVIGQGSLADAAVHALGRKVVVAVPGQDVLLSAVSWSARNRARVRQAVPYLLEEQLIGEVERQHFALGQWDGEQLAVAVVSRHQMDDWQQRLSLAGLTVACMLPDFMVIPAEQEAWSLFMDEHACLVRRGMQSGFSVDPESAPYLVELALCETPVRPAAIHDLGNTAAPWLEAVAGAHSIPCHRREISFLEVWAQTYDERGALNLLQGEYSQQERLSRLLRPWLPAAIVLGGWVLLNTLVAGIEYWQLSQQREQLRQQISQVYLNTFPDARRVVNARVQMEQHLRELRDQQRAAGGPTLSLLAALSEVMAGEGGYKLQLLRVEQQQLEINLQVPSLGALEQFKQRLAGQRGVQLEVISVTSKQTGVDVQARIKGAVQ